MLLDRRARLGLERLAVPLHFGRPAVLKVNPERGEFGGEHLTNVQNALRERKGAGHLEHEVAQRSEFLEQSGSGFCRERVVYGSDCTAFLLTGEQILHARNCAIREAKRRLKAPRMKFVQFHRAPRNLPPEMTEFIASRQVKSRAKFASRAASVSGSSAP